MAMYKYNGVRLRGVPAWNTGVYPNAIIYYVANENGIEEAHFGYSDQPFYLDTTYNLVTNTEGATIYASIYDATTNTWGEVYLFYDAAFALEPEKVIWGNVDVLDDTGAVFLAGSEPVKLFPRRWWTNLLIAGLCSRPLPMGTREPVAWLYNGVRLPGLPVWDRVKYPYAFIGYDLLMGYMLYILPVPLIAYLSGNVEAVGKPGSFIEYKGAEYYENAWGELVTFYMQSDAGITPKPIWSNYDILNEDGTLYLAASDPVPVYE